MDAVAADEIERELREASRGLLFMSEADYPVEVVRWRDPQEVTPEFLRGLSGESPTAPVEVISPEEFFRAATSEPDWKVGTELATAQRFQVLLGLLGTRLTDLKAYRVGRVNMTVYVVGRAPSGEMMGVSTRVVET
ncbi:MAG: nuclease A inhibitor family protein [Pyrinomonadaceae bacterium]